MHVNLPNTIVYWPPGPPDQFGQPTLGTPVEYAARWDDGISETVGNDGALVYSSASVILLSDVAVGGMMFLGTLLQAQDSAFVASRTNKLLREIIAKTRNPALRGGYVVVTAHLK